MESDADVMIDLEAGLNTELYQIANELEINKLVVIGGGKIALAYKCLLFMFRYK